MDDGESWMKDVGHIKIVETSHCHYPLESQLPIPESAWSKWRITILLPAKNAVGAFGPSIKDRRTARVASRGAHS